MIMVLSVAIKLRHPITCYFKVVTRSFLLLLILSVLKLLV